MQDFDKILSERKNKTGARRGIENETNFTIQEQAKEEDIYDYAHNNVKELIRANGKYNLQIVPSPNLESRPVKIYRNGCKYLGQWNTSTNT